MKNLINIAIVSLTLLISNYALADFQDGLNAYDKQDYDAAFEEWQPLAKQGNADAQNNLGTMYIPKIILCTCIFLLSCFLIPRRSLLSVF
jgi:hypothetical protein